MRQLLQSTAALIGMIVGVGIFAVPYVVAHAGFALGMGAIAGLGLVVLVIHLLYGDVVRATPGRHRLPGYANAHIGPNLKHIAATVEVLGFWGAQIAYLIVGGKFLSLFIGGDNDLLFSTAIFAFVGIITFFGIKILGKVELWMTILLIAVVGVVISAGAPYINPDYLMIKLAGFQPAAVSFGVILFALTGASAIPEMFDIVRGKKKELTGSIVLGTIIPIVITLFFALVVVGITGPVTTADALSGLAEILPQWVMLAGALFGFLAVATSYLVLALYLKELFAYDYKLKHVFAWFAGVGVPFVLLLAGARNLIQIIDLTGGIFTALEGLIIVLVAIALYRRRHKAFGRVKIAFGIGAMAILLVGMIEKLLSLFLFQ